MNINIFQELPRLRSRFGRCAVPGYEPPYNCVCQLPNLTGRIALPDRYDPVSVWDCKGKNLF